MPGPMLDNVECVFQLCSVCDQCDRNASSQSLTAKHYLEVCVLVQETVTRT